MGHGSCFGTDSGPILYALQGPGQVTALHLLDPAAARGGRLVTFDTRIAGALKPYDRRYLHLL